MEFSKGLLYKTAIHLTHAITAIIREQLISAAIICGFLEAFGSLVIGFIIFKEKFNSIELAGIFFGVFSLILFTASNKS
jgi:drug/metabolite transporter (DMT)-like permease